MANGATYKGIYAMHKYWGKKPFNVLSNFIERYTDEGDTVLDSFCGSGVTVLEALKMGRKSIGVDLNPIAIKIAQVSVTAIEPEHLKKEFETLRENVQSKINQLYEVDESGEKTIVTHTIWKENKPIEVWYTTPKEKKVIRAGREIDIKMAQEPFGTPAWYPNAKLFENSRINVFKGEKVSDLFTPRARMALSWILEEIQKIDDPALKNVFEVTFTGALSQASNLVFVIRNRKKGKAQRAEVGSWVIGYWVPKEHFEINVWNCFENRFKRVLRGEQEIYELFQNLQPTPAKDLVRLINGTATNLPLEDDSIDYVFIDPPHADRILYMEQSMMWNAWLDLEKTIDWQEEIIISESKERKEKTRENYMDLLEKAFAEIQRVLKPQKFFSIAFNSLEDTMWADILNILLRQGFEMIEIIPLEYSATSVIQDNRKNALKTDIVITLRNSRNISDKRIVVRDDETSLRKKIHEITKNHPEYAMYNVMNELFTTTLPKGYIYKASQISRLYKKMQ